MNRWQSLEIAGWVLAGVALAFGIITCVLIACDWLEARRARRMLRAPRIIFPDRTEFGDASGNKYRAFVPRWYELHRWAWWVWASHPRNRDKTHTGTIQLLNPWRHGQEIVRCVKIADAPTVQIEVPISRGPRYLDL